MNKLKLKCVGRIKKIKKAYITNPKKIIILYSLRLLIKLKTLFDQKGIKRMNM